jgi:hypothetical protein
MRMVTLLGVLGIAGGAGYFAWAKVLRPPEKRACARLTELCGDHLDRKDDKDHDCEEFFAAIKRNAPEAIEPTSKCVTEARSCGQAVGCVAGGAIHIGTGFARDFADGLGKSLSQ